METRALDRDEDVVGVDAAAGLIPRRGDAGDDLGQDWSSKRVDASADDANKCYFYKQFIE